MTVIVRFDELYAVNGHFATVLIGRNEHDIESIDGLFTSSMMDHRAFIECSFIARFERGNE